MVEKVAVQPADFLRGLEQPLRRSAAWWLRELRVLFPHITLGADQARKSLLSIELASGLIRCHLHLGTGEQRCVHRTTNFGEAALGQWLVDAGTARERTSISLAIHQDLFFERGVALPRAALHALPRILDQELLRRTPFDPASVWHGGGLLPDGAAADVVEVRHWIIRRDRVDAMLRAANLSYAAVDFLVVTDQSGDALASIPIRQQEAPETKWARQAIQLLAGLAVMVSIAGLGVVNGVQSRTADRLDEELAAARQLLGGTKADGVSRFVLQKSGSSFAVIWEEVSRLLPDDTYLSELRFADGNITLSGFSRDAPGLVKVLGRSQLLERIGLAGAIVSGAAEGRDQFRISAIVRRGRTDSQPGRQRGRAAP